ncbi:MAG: hypothetical protein Tsb0013_10740 [Phycisphaerales bacterium]
MTHLLAIGATGMLAGALRTLAGGFEDVTVVARHASAFDLPDATPVDADWTDAGAFTRAIHASLLGRDDVTDALVWAHHGATEAVRAVLLAMPARSRVVHVHASAQGDPSERIALWRRVCEPRVRYTSVVLGRVRGGSSSRWLTHPEICDGVLRAWRTGESVVVGSL